MKRDPGTLASYRTLLSDFMSCFSFPYKYGLPQFCSWFLSDKRAPWSFLSYSHISKKKKMLISMLWKKKLVTQPNSSSACVCKKWSETIIKCGGELFASNSMNMFSQFLIDGYAPPDK